MQLNTDAPSTQTLLGLCLQHSMTQLANKGYGIPAGLSLVDSNGVCLQTCQQHHLWGSVHLLAHPMPVNARCQNTAASAAYISVVATATTRSSPCMADRPDHRPCSTERACCLSCALPTVLNSSCLPSWLQAVVECPAQCRAAAAAGEAPLPWVACGRFH